MPCREWDPEKAAEHWNSLPDPSMAELLPKPAQAVRLFAAQPAAVRPVVVIQAAVLWGAERPVAVRVVVSVQTAVRLIAVRLAAQQLSPLL